MKNKMFAVFCSFALACLVAPMARAQGSAVGATPPPRTITVTATSEIEVVPDQAVLSLSLSTFEKDLAEGKARHDQRAKELQDIAVKEGVRPTDIQSSRISIWTERSERGKPRNVRLTSTMTLRVRELSRYDELLTGLLNAGIESIQSVEFTVSDKSKYKAQARLAAVRAARVQAEAMAEALGQRLGRPLVVTEGEAEAQQQTQPYFNRAIRALANNYEVAEFSNTRQGFQGGEPEAVAAGQIVFRMRVIASFELL